MSVRELLIASFRAALSAADPLEIIPAHLPLPPTGKTIVIGAGKAAASTAHAIESRWPPDKPLGGLVITRYAHGLTEPGNPSLQRIRVVEAGHPLPDEAGHRAAIEMVSLTQSATKDDLLIAAFSGGGSSLFSLPVDGVDFADLQAVTKALLRSGAPITEMNVVRKHLSKVQGGRLAAMCQAPILGLIISDVAGDNPGDIASGPTAPDPSTFQDALDILHTYRIVPPLSIARHLSRGVRGEVTETLKPGDAIFNHVENRVVAGSWQSLSRAAAYFQQRGITPMILGDSVTGEAREVARVYAALAKQIRQHHHPCKPPVALISGGECTVTLGEGNGRGGRCSTFLLSLAIELDGLSGISAIACDTDGIDGSENNAGAIICGDTLARASALGLRAKTSLGAHDAYGFFAALGDLIVTGPTRTNVNDYRVILVH